MRGYFLAFLLCLSLFAVHANNRQEADSLSLSVSKPQKMSIIDYKFKPTQLILPAALITTGAIGHSVKGMKDYKLFTRRTTNDRIHLDDYLEWGLLGWVFACDLIGKEKNNWIDQLFLLGIAEGFNAVMVHSLKNMTAISRPDQGNTAFPSGHTANAFLGAHLAFKEFKDSSMFLALSGYPIAAFVASARLYSNRHWGADVVAGAGFGILSVELAYLIYVPIKNAIARKVNMKANNKLVITPTVNTQGGGLYIAFTF